MISVIVPVYNAEKYLERCVRSILAQRCRDFELLLVNDGSTDGSLALCQHFAALDGRIRSINKENGGVSSARNAGIAQARGDYLFFVDADDWIEPDTLEQCLVHAQSHDLVWCGARFEREDGRLLRALSFPEGSVPDAQLEDLFFTRYETTAACWGKLFSRKAVGTIRFDENYAIGEDMKFHFDVLQGKPSVYALADCLYHYVQYGTSTLHNNFDTRNFDMLAACEYVLPKVSPQCRSVFFLYSNSIVCALYAMLATNPRQDFYDRLKAKLTTYFWTILRYGRPKVKLFALIYRICPFSVAARLSGAVRHFLAWMRK